MATASGAVAQVPPEPAPLPPVTVETTKAVKKPAAKKKSATAKAATKAKAAPIAQPEPGVTGASQGETATGPVDGVVATRSATGSKTDTPIVETPRTVNVITKDQIEAQQPQSVRDAVSYTPGVQNQTGSASNLDDITIRGFLAPIYLDGLLLPVGPGSNARLRLEPHALERLEVLKGPASALFGQVPPGGLINGISKLPQSEPHREVFVQYGSNDYRATGFDFTGPIDPAGDLSYRLVGLARDTDLDIDFAEQERYYIAPSLTWRPSAATSLTLLGSAQKDGGFGPRQYVPFALTKKDAPFGRISRSTYLGEPTLDDYDEEQWSVGYQFAHRFNDVLQFRQNARYMDVEQATTNVRASGLAGGSNRSLARTLNGTVADFQAFTIDNQVQADFNTGPLKHRVLGGVDYQHIDNFTKFAVVFPFAFSPIDAYNPVYGNTPVTDPLTAGTPFAFNESTVEQTGVYLQDQIKLGRWIATLGGRYDWATTDLEDFRVGQPPNQKLDDEDFTGFAALSYLFDSGLAPYVSYSTSFLPYGGTNISSLINPATGQAYKPTTGEAYEAGIKYQPPNTKTLIAASVFEITQQNMNTTNIALNRVEQTGEVRMRGFELEAKSSITENIDVMAGYGYIEPIITETGNAANIGNDFMSISRHSASAWGMYTWRSGFLAGFGAGAGLRYVGTNYVEEANITKVPAHTLLDAVFKYDLAYVDPTFNGASLQVNGYNLTDEYYVASCATTAAFCQLGAARSFIATLKYEW